MKILLAPSETKTALCNEKFISKENFIFPNLYEKRLQIITLYNDFIKNADFNELCRIFGTKKEKEIHYYGKDIFKSGCIKAILRYSGVAFKSLDYRGLDINSQKFIDDNLLIFSNLFGILSAKDEIPNYKLKQGEKIGEFDTQKFYFNELKDEIDKFLENDDILDLRAEYYNKFYIPNKEFLTMKFYKNGKALSHFAKDMRGKIARQVAQNNLNTNEKVMAFNFENLKLNDIKKLGNKIEISYAIL